MGLLVFCSFLLLAQIPLGFAFATAPVCRTSMSAQKIAVVTGANKVIEFYHVPGRELVSEV
jgi:hypothetical protein